MDTLYFVEHLYLVIIMIMTVVQLLLPALLLALASTIAYLLLLLLTPTVFLSASPFGMAGANSVYRFTRIWCFR